MTRRAKAGPKHGRYTRETEKAWTYRGNDFTKSGRSGSWVVLANADDTTAEGKTSLDAIRARWIPRNLLKHGGALVLVADAHGVPVTDAHRRKIR